MTTTTTTPPTTWRCSTCGAHIRLDDRWITDDAELCGPCAFAADPEWIEELEEPAHHAPSDYVERCRIAREERRRRTWPPSPVLDARRDLEAADRAVERASRKRERARRESARRLARRERARW